MDVSPLQSHPSAALAPLGLASALHFNPARLRNATPEAQRAAVASQFEAVLVRQLLGKTMTSMLGGQEGGVAGSIYGDMLADTLAQQLSAGPGLGFARFLEKQLAPRGEAPAASGESPAPSSTVPPPS